MTYASRLEGIVLPDGWTVGQRITAVAGQTGGRYSCSYHAVRTDGTLGFVKALDFSSALQDPDPTAALERLVKPYNFERDLLLACQAKRMDRIVLALAHGSVLAEPGNVQSAVPYIVFERGRGDIRLHMTSITDVYVCWVMKVAHQIALGLSQLHRADVAHQDLKPSNVLVFADNENKIGDLGHAVKKGEPLVRPEHSVIGGDPAHAPPEQLYGAAPSDWAQHRIAGDLYHLGSMVVFLLANVTMTALLDRETAGPFKYSQWRGTYADALPAVRSAYSSAITAFAAELPTEIRDEVTTAVRQLCDPDPTLRGHPIARAQRFGNPYSLDRYVSLFDKLYRTVSKTLARKSP